MKINMTFTGNRLKRGFTMIELVFVIVILGILASIAVPKLVATKDDAGAVKAAQELANVITEVTAYYTVKGDFIDKDGKPIKNKGERLFQDKFRNISPTMYEVMNRSNNSDNWTKCLDIFIDNLNSTILIFKQTFNLDTNYCKAVRNVPSVVEWFKISDEKLPEDDRGIKIGGSSIFAP